MPLRNETAYRILRFLEENPGSRKGTICEAVGISPWMWKDWRESLDLYMSCDEGNRWDAHGNASQEWLETRQFRAHNGALHKARQHLLEVAERRLEPEDWIRELAQAHDILMWVQGHTPASWDECEEERMTGEAEGLFMGYPEGDQRPWNRLSLLMED